MRKKSMILVPSEMVDLVLKKSKLEEADEAITIFIEEASQ